MQKQDKEKNAVYRFLYLFTIYLCTVYLAVTLLNLHNNKRNVEKLKREGFFDDTKIMSVAESEDEGVLWILVEAMRYYAMKGRPDMVSRIKKHKSLFKVSELICFDPGFSRYTQRIKGPSRVDNASECFFVDSYYKQFKDTSEGDSYAKALRSYQKVLKADPEDIDAYMSLGNIYAIRGDYDKAIYSFQKAIEINPGFSAAYFRSGDIYALTGDCDRALQSFKILIQLRPSCGEGHWRLAMLYDKKMDYDKVVEHFNKFIQINPNAVFPYSDLGYTTPKTGEFYDILRRMVESNKLNFRGSSSYENNYRWNIMPRGVKRDKADDKKN